MRALLVDGTYELFRQYYGRAAHDHGGGSPTAAARGVLASTIALLSDGATHIGVATDHVVESFRNALWPGYKTGDAIPSDLRAQFELVEEALVALGVVVWPMTDLEADDALASAASVLEADPAVDEVVLYTPDKDLAQCVRGRRVVQFDRRSGAVVDEAAVWERYGVPPASIPDWLALSGDPADGFPGLRGWGRRSASVALAHYGSIDAIPDDVTCWDPTVRSAIRSASRLADRLAADRVTAELFRTLATLRDDADVIPGGSAQLRWHGPTSDFSSVCRQLGEPALLARVEKLASR